MTILSSLMSLRNRAGLSVERRQPSFWSRQGFSARHGLAETFAAHDGKGLRTYVGNSSQAGAGCFGAGLGLASGCLGLAHRSAQRSPQCPHVCLRRGRGKKAWLDACNRRWESQEEQAPSSTLSATSAANTVLEDEKWSEVMV